MNQVDRWARNLTLEERIETGKTKEKKRGRTKA